MLLTSILIDGDFLGTAIASHMVADYDLETGGSSSVSGRLKKYHRFELILRYEIVYLAYINVCTFHSAFTESLGKGSKKSNHDYFMGGAL